MAITQDGDQLFGITETTINSLVVESFTLSKNGNRIDLNDGDGEPIGAVITEGRTEVSATVQAGVGSAPTIGQEITLSSGYDTNTTMVITSVEKTETAADYARFSLGGYLKIN
jgi:hypothetical protein